MKYQSFLIILAFQFFSSVGHSDPLAQTQQFLKDPNQRETFFKSNPSAKESDDKVKALSGKAGNSEHIYGLAADVMGNLANESSGDPDKMEKALEKAMTDPASFADTFSPEQRKKLRSIAEEIEKANSLP